MFGYDPAFGRLFVVTPYDIQQSNIIKLMCQQAPQQVLKRLKVLCDRQIVIILTIHRPLRNLAQIRLCHNGELYHQCR